MDEVTFAQARMGLGELGRVSRTVPMDRCCVCGREAFSLVHEDNVLHPLWWDPSQPLECRLQYEGCDGCGFVRLASGLSLEVLKTYYRVTPTPSQEVFAKRAGMYDSRVEFIRESVGRRLRGTLIEVGPAYGDFLARFSEFEERIGIEPSREYRKLVRARGLPFVYHDCLLEEVSVRCPQILGCGNLVAACNVLEHAVSPADFIRALAALARAKGWVYLEVPSVEAMAECHDPCYQTLHVGHVSHFAVPVLNRLCVAAGLSPVRTEWSARDSYPVVRALYQKDPSPTEIHRMFMWHAAGRTATADEARGRLLAILEETGAQRLAIWGCGQDLLDVLNRLSEQELVALQSRTVLVDANTRKQQRGLVGLTIRSPDALLGKRPNVVIVASRSQLIVQDIRNTVCDLLGPIPTRLLYEPGSDIKQLPSE
ncbi:methyltransferase domain-containing protein [Planctomycetota bacterium]